MKSINRYYTKDFNGGLECNFATYRILKMVQLFGNVQWNKFIVCNNKAKKIVDARKSTTFLLF